MEIVKASLADLDGIVRLNAVVQQIHTENVPGRFCPVNADAIRQQMHKAFLDPEILFFVAIEEETVQGYVMVHRCERAETAYSYQRSFLELEQIAVLPDARKHGIGSALVDQVFAYAKSLGLNRVELSVWAFNATAQRFFTSKGLSTCWQRMDISIS